MTDATSMTSHSTPPIDPELETRAEQTGLDDDQLVEGEAVVDLTIPADVDYDVDDLGDGRLAIQYWEADG
ncbi:MAG: hypothetical protein ABEI98_10835 [Halorhabdus sp.]